MTSACRSENPNPEQLDPIYKDLVKTYKDYSEKLTDAKAQVEQAQADLSSAKVGSKEKVVAKRDLAAAKENLLNYQQLSQFYKIRSERRRVEGRRQYRISFQKGEDWPDPNEYQQYLVHKKLRASPRAWETRVPKLFVDGQRSVSSDAYTKEE